MKVVFIPSPMAWFAGFCLKNHKEPRIAALIPTSSRFKYWPSRNTDLPGYLNNMFSKHRYPVHWIGLKENHPRRSALTKKCWQNHWFGSTQSDLQRNWRKILGGGHSPATMEYDKWYFGCKDKAQNAYVLRTNRLYRKIFPPMPSTVSLKLQAERFRSPVYVFFIRN
jgi:hypothetical protein